MAERRMFAKTIIDSDAFLDMPQSSQLLYFHLSMRADDDGFINKPKSIMRVTGSKDDDINLLIAKKFIIPFDSGIVVIKHWKIHNYIQKDRYIETKYKDELGTLALDENKAYTRDLDPCIHSVSTLDTQVRLGKDRDRLELGKDRIEIEGGVGETSTGRERPTHTRFTKPTLSEVKTYCEERQNHVDAQRFIDFYESKGWRVGQTPMKDWKAAVRTWEGNGYAAPAPKQSSKTDVLRRVMERYENVD